AFFDQPATGEMHSRGGPGGHLANRFFEREDAPLSHITRDQARKVAVAAGMRQSKFVLFASPERRPGVAADARPGKAQRRFDVLLAHHVIDRHDSTLALRDQIEGGVSRLFAPLLRDLSHGFAVESGVAGVARIDHYYAIPSASGLDNVPPAGRTGSNLSLQSHPRFRIRQAF